MRTNIFSLISKRHKVTLSRGYKMFSVVTCVAWISLQGDNSWSVTPCPPCVSSKHHWFRVLVDGDWKQEGTSHVQEPGSVHDLEMLGSIDWVGSWGWTLGKDCRCPTSFLILNFKMLFLSPSWHDGDLANQEKLSYSHNTLFNKARALLIHW